MFEQRTPLFVDQATDEYVNDVIKAEVQDVISKRDNKRMSIEQMVEEIEKALAYIGFVDVDAQENSSYQSNDAENESYSDDVVIL